MMEALDKTKKLNKKLLIEYCLAIAVFLILAIVFIVVSAIKLTGDQWSIVGKSMWITILQTVLSTALAYVLGLPVGVLLNVTSKNGLKPCKWLNFIVGIIVNILRSVPCLILIVLCIPWTRGIFGVGTGKWYTILIPLVVTAFGFVARMVEQSLAEVPAGELEAVRSLGASNWQLIVKVLIPESRSSLVSGIAVSAVSILGYTSFAYNIGADGLIATIYSFYTRNTGNYLSSWYFWVLIIIVVIIVQVIQELGLFISKKLDKRRILK